MRNKIFALTRTIVFGAVFGSLWLWFLPRWIADGKGTLLRPIWSPGGLLLMAIGAAFVLPSMFQFAWLGHGTPAPFDPPRRLVIRGPYRWVRNPMYVGMGLLMAGEGILLPSIRREMFAAVVFFWLLTTAFVMLYEERALRRRFGEEYESYCRHVRRWIPRLTPFD